MDWQAQFQADRALVEGWLSDFFRDRAPYADLQAAMAYSLLAGGKRVRPVLLLESCRMCGGEVEAALPFAGAVEMVHTYSLIHDDLPCMDNDDLRRGRPTNHKVYGEAGAVLAGDALLTAAFETVTRPGGGLPAGRVLAAAACLSRAAGDQGMVGGQSLDMAGEGHGLSEEQLREMYALKTGALIQAAAEMGCLLAGGSETQRRAVVRYAQCLGLAFQIQDDILDVSGQEAVLGKPVGSDLREEKSTFVTLLGVEGCRRRIRRLNEEALEALAPFERGGFLRWLVERLAGREN